MNFRNISAWCIRNPVPPIVFFLGLLLAGVVSFMGMQVNNNPDIDFPAAQVIISQPGAAPSEMETQITQRVESAIRGVNGVDEINSSIREGNSNTMSVRLSSVMAMPFGKARSAATSRRASSSRRSAASTSPAIRSSSSPPKHPT